jgi:hypothetical protein
MILAIIFTIILCGCLAIVLFSIGITKSNVYIISLSLTALIIFISSYSGFYLIAKDRAEKEASLIYTRSYDLYDSRTITLLKDFHDEQMYVVIPREDGAIKVKLYSLRTIYNPNTNHKDPIIVQRKFYHECSDILLFDIRYVSYDEYLEYR